MAVYQKKTIRRARPTTRRLMKQANALQKTLSAMVKSIIPEVAQIESDFAFGIIEDIQAQYMKEAKRTKPTIYKQSNNPCWRCAGVPAELINDIAGTPEQLLDLMGEPTDS